ncbi:MAG: DNA gyrase subunit B, partial [Pseudomonadota bacterium]
HIRTLLLTFFFRQMPELLERGHVFIAQPPLYKVKKGKQQRYVKDDEELNTYFTELALQDASLFVNKDAPGLQGEALESLVLALQNVQMIIDRMKRKYPTDILSLLIRLPRVTDEIMQSETAMRAWADQFEALLKDVDGSNAEVEVVQDPEHQIYLPVARLLLKGISEEIRFGYNFMHSNDYAAIGSLAEELQGLVEPDGYIKRGEKTQAVSHFVDAYEWLLAEARRGVDIQRYKGLGEMNPDQLWETTMDPEVRRMLQVTVDDAIGADQIFTTLMGDQVEPRREFIESNALAVVNLDV